METRFGRCAKAVHAFCADACAGVGGMGYISVVWPESDDGTGGGGHVVPDLVLVVVPGAGGAPSVADGRLLCGVYAARPGAGGGDVLEEEGGWRLAGQYALQAAAGRLDVPPE